MHPDFHRRPMPSELAVFCLLFGSYFGSYSAALVMRLVRKVTLEPS